MSTRKIKLTLSFDGTAYSGWQVQKNAPSIQGILQEKIARITNEQVGVVGAGRTDAGVHALAMTCHFETSTTIPEIAFSRGLNSMLPDDIRILEAVEVPSAFHARFDSVSKCYRYQFVCDEILSPFDRHYFARFQGPLNFDEMKEALRYLMGQHDFSSFEATGSRDVDLPGRGAVRTLLKAALVEMQSYAGSPAYAIEVCGDGFLRHMVRNIVGTVVEVAKGKLSPVDVGRILAAKDRNQAGPTAPACGLFLVKVEYD